MLDTYNRKINYLRISITDRCNLRCLYCMPDEGIQHIDHKKVVTYEEIMALTKEAVSMGVEKIRVTGGEPLVRKGVVNFISMLSQLKIKDLAMTTNGALLERFAIPLKKAGLHRINISLDTINPEKYRKITRKGDIRDVLRGIDAALDAGLAPIKINTVVEASRLEKDALEVKEFADSKGLQIRFIRKMDLKKGTFWVVDGGTGGDCKVCNRLRLSSDGTLFPCLFSDIGFNIRELGCKEALLQAIQSKPERGILSKTKTFYNMGG